MKIENYNHLTQSELFELIELKVKEQTKNWTTEDNNLLLEAMKNISERPIWNAIYQAKKWALIESRASVVNINNEKDRREWFDREIEMVETLIENTNQK